VRPSGDVMQLSEKDTPCGGWVKEERRSRVGNKLGSTVVWRGSWKSVVGPESSVEAKRERRHVRGAKGSQGLDVPRPGHK
jgi:hypothetical protein